MSKKALLLMNMGGATTKAELRMFLLNMFRDPNILTIRSDFFRSLLAKLIVLRRLDTSWANYEGIGGSPLPRITDELVNKLTERIGNEYLILPVMCYTKPGNEEAIAKLMESGITEVVLFPLYPHYSTTTVKSSVESFLDALKKSNIHVAEPAPAHAGVILNGVEGNEESRISGKKYHIRSIEPFYTDESYNQVIVEKIKEQLKEQNPPNPLSQGGTHRKTQNLESDILNLESGSTTLIFSAHGLPEKIIKKGDPYQKQVEEHVEILTKMLREKGVNFKQIKLAYQSRVGPMKWIGPSLEETLSELKGEKVLIYPISFTIDNSETIYELHREYADHAKQFGVSTYDVCDCPNTHSEFVESIINKISLR